MTPRIPDAVFIEAVVMAPSFADAARALGCYTKEGVRARARRLKVAPLYPRRVGRRRRHTDEEIAAAIKEHGSYQAAGRALGCSGPTICVRAHALCIPSPIKARGRAIKTCPHPDCQRVWLPKSGRGHYAARECPACNRRACRNGRCNPPACRQPRRRNGGTCPTCGSDWLASRLPAGVRAVIVAALLASGWSLSHALSFVRRDGHGRDPALFDALEAICPSALERGLALMRAGSSLTYAAGKAHVGTARLRAACVEAGIPLRGRGRPRKARR